MVLFHGTAKSNTASIRAAGFQKQRRHHVHLSGDVDTAWRVGARHGVPVLWQVDAAAVHSDGIGFFRSDNDVWLTDAVGPAYLWLRE